MDQIQVPGRVAGSLDPGRQGAIEALAPIPQAAHEERHGALPAQSPARSGSRLGGGRDEALALHAQVDALNPSLADTKPSDQVSRRPLGVADHEPSPLQGSALLL